MKRPSKGRDVSGKTRRPNSAKLKQRDVPTWSTRRSASDVGQNEKIRLLARELNEALRRETAAYDVLHIISNSSGELGPVFRAILEKAIAICDAKFGSLFRFDGSTLRSAVQVGAPTAVVEAQNAQGGPVPGSLLDRVMKTKQVHYTADAAADLHPGIAAKFAGARSIVGVPMLREDKLIGAILVYRQEVRPFDERQIGLLKSFAAQAVIAIENGRLLNELHGSLERQTATSEVLRTISSSLGDLQPVFDKMLQNAIGICDAKYGGIYQWDGETMRLAAMHNAPPAFAEARRLTPFHPSPSHVLGRVIASKTVLHIEDAATDPAYVERRPNMVAAVELGARERSFASRC